MLRSWKQSSCFGDFAYVITNNLRTLPHHRLNKTAQGAWPSVLSNERKTRDQNRGEISQDCRTEFTRPWEPQQDGVIFLHLPK